MADEDEQLARIVQESRKPAVTWFGHFGVTRWWLDRLISPTLGRPTLITEKQEEATFGLYPTLFYELGCICVSMPKLS